jgi:hypothetical protein
MNEMSLPKSASFFFWLASTCIGVGVKFNSLSVYVAISLSCFLSLDLLVEVYPD